MQDAADDFTNALAASAERVEARLGVLLGSHALDDEIVRPERLMKAMRHAALGGGKRLRPFLIIETAKLFQPARTVLEAALDVAVALECVHCYSLVHDDLPAMDDDAIRRGQPTVHIAFDEATAILAGDALLTLAFDIVADPAGELDAARRIALVSALARAAGPGGMVGGQMLDLAAETNPPDEAGVIRLQAMKTGALMRFACEAGAIVAGAKGEDRQRLRQFGETIGLAFQLADDLLDLTAEGGAIGKATGKDQARNKATLVARHGQAWAETQLGGLVAEATELLAPFGERAGTLIEAARFVASRQS